MTSFRKYQRYFNSLGTLLFQERYDRLARYYALPLEANLAGNWFTILSTEEMVMHLRRHHVALLNRGTTAIVSQVVALELSSPQPRIWVRWSKENPTLPQGRVANVMYNMTDRGPAPQVSKLSYTSLMMPEFAKASINKRLMPRI